MLFWQGQHPRSTSSPTGTAWGMQIQSSQRHYSGNTRFTLTCRRVSLCCSSWYPKFCFPLTSKAVILICLHSPVPFLCKFLSECFYAGAYHANEFRATVTTVQLSQRMCCQGLYFVLLLCTEHWLRKSGSCTLLQSWNTVTLFRNVPKHCIATSRTALTQKSFLGIVFQYIIYGILFHCTIGK